jgi:hypothetical protein
MLIRIEAPTFVAGIILSSKHICVKTAPILSWCLNKDIGYLAKAFDKRGWIYECVS